MNRPVLRPKPLSELSCLSSSAPWPCCTPGHKKGPRWHTRLQLRVSLRIWTFCTFFPASRFSRDILGIILGLQVPLWGDFGLLEYPRAGKSQESGLTGRVKTLLYICPHRWRLSPGRQLVGGPPPATDEPATLPTVAELGGPAPPISRSAFFLPTRTIVDIQASLPSLRIYRIFPLSEGLGEPTVCVAAVIGKAGVR